MYLDSAYIAKYYLNEPDSSRVRDAVASARRVQSSALAIAEVTCVFHRHVRERRLSADQGWEFIDLFETHIDGGLIALVQVTDSLLRQTAVRVRQLPSNVLLRAADAVHLSSALEAGEREVWTNDRHMLAAAPYFGLSGRSV